MHITAPQSPQPLSAVFSFSSQPPSSVPDIIVAGYPFAQARKAGINYTLAHVELIQHIPDAPAQVLVDYVLYGILRLSVQEILYIVYRHGDYAEEGLLVNDALVYGRRFHDHHSAVSHVLIVLL